MTTYPAPNDPLPEGYLSPETSELAHQMRLANDARLEAQHWQEQSRNADKKIIELINENSMLKAQIANRRDDAALSELLHSIDALREDLRANAQRQGTSNA